MNGILQNENGVQSYFWETSKNPNALGSRCALWPTYMLFRKPLKGIILFSEMHLMVRKEVVDSPQIEQITNEDSIRGEELSVYR